MLPPRCDTLCGVINPLAQAFPIPALRKVREGTGHPQCWWWQRDQKPGPHRPVSSSCVQDDHED
jgi:hypothetical protein